MTVERYDVGRDLARHRRVAIKSGHRFTKDDIDALNGLFEAERERYGPFARSLEKIEAGCAEILRRAGLPDRPGHYVWRRSAGEQKWRWSEQTPEDDLNDIIHEDRHRIEEAREQLERLGRMKLRPAERRRREKRLKEECRPSVRSSNLYGAASIDSDSTIRFDDPAGYAVRILERCEEVRKAVASGEPWAIAREGYRLGLLVQEAGDQEINQERRKRPRGARNPWLGTLVEMLFEELRAHQQPLTAREAWDRISDDEDYPFTFESDGDKFEAWREERETPIRQHETGILVARRDRDGNSYRVTFRTFRQYFGENRKKFALRGE